MSMFDAIELAAIRGFAELHSSGCQSPHGGRCACGWNLIEARLEELRGADPARVTYLRDTVRFTYDEDQERIAEILADINRRAQRETTGGPEHPSDVRGTESKA